MYINNQKFMVLGVSKSGHSVCKKVLEKGGTCFLYEEKRNGKAYEYVQELVNKGATLVERENFETVLKGVDVLVVSPGVPINHEVAVKAKRLGVKIMGEVEFGFRCLMPSICAITGTNGKTTTCSMVEKIFQTANKKHSLIGNIGVPVSSKVNDISSDDVCITEISSFQLETAMTFCPHVSCILNISPDHLERHYTMENYIFLKKRIYANQRQSEFCLLNYDDLTIKEFSSEVKAKIIWISCENEVDGGYFKDGKLYYYNEEIIDALEMGVSGKQNVYNALFAICISKVFGIENKHIKEGLRLFKGVRHRIEQIGEIGGVRFFDDSKGTNVSSTLSAIDSMNRPTTIILGGSEKGESYDLLFEKIKDSVIKHIVITGASRFNMLESAGRIGVGNITVTSDFVHAVKIAKMIAESGENVLLSPACASFDSFNGYEERGDAFSKIVGINSDERY